MKIKFRSTRISSRIIKKLTSAERKYVGVPKTNEEKFKIMAQKNPNLEKLKALFDLDISL